MSRDPSLSSSFEALVPEGWPGIEGLVCGFGHRRALPPRTAVLLERQVHGTVVVRAPSDTSALRRDPGDGLARVAADADALVASSPGLVAGVRTADCVPLLLVAPRHRWAAAVHAGWRGTVGGIAVEAVKVAVDAGIRPEDLFAALGPSIGPCCYEVSEDLGEQFGNAGLPVRSPGGGTWAGRSGGKPHLDLRAANRVLLERAGVPVAQVQNVGPCTRCSRGLFHSFRAEPESAGRQVSWVGWA